MSKFEYASLHNHSQSSILDGFGTVPEYLERAVKIGLKGVGLADHGSVAGIYEFIEKSRALGLVPTPGCEMYVAPINPLGAKMIKPVYYGPNGQKGTKYDVSSSGAYLHLTVMAVNSQGLHNLFKLSSLSNSQDHYYFKPRIDFEMLEQHSDGLVIATGCPSSEISTRFLLGQDDKAYEYAGRLKEVFGKERLFVEVMNHEMSDPLERLLLPKQVKLAKDLGLGLLATNDSHYAHKHDAQSHEEMLCIQSGSLMSDKTFDEGGGRFAFNGEQFYLKSGEEMAELFPEDQFPGALSNSLLISEMSQDVEIAFDPHLKPIPKIPYEFKNEESYMKKLINDGFKERYGNMSDEIKAEALKRIKHEFEVIHSSDFIGYFLTVYEYLKFARDNYSTLGPDNEILALPTGPGRGSVGGSVIAFVLFISEVDPIKHDLIFERFLSAGRGATYEITYDDGTTERVNVSETKHIDNAGNTENRYIHQLNVGDEVITAI